MTDTIFVIEYACLCTQSSELFSRAEVNYPLSLSLWLLKDKFSAKTPEEQFHSFIALGEEELSKLVNHLNQQHIC